MKLKANLSFEDFLEMEQMERLYYSDEFITPAEEAMRWYQMHPYSVKVVEVEGEIVGFMNLFPIAHDVAECIRSGEFNDHDLKAEEILSPEHPEEPLQLLLSCIVVKENRRNIGVISQLMRSYVKEIDGWGKEVRDVLMETVTSDGTKFARRMGMERTREKKDTIVWKISYDRFKKNVT